MFFLLLFIISNASMYNAHETITVESERENNEKRQADDRKTKQKMESIRSKLKTHPRKVRRNFMNLIHNYLIILFY